MARMSIYVSDRLKEAIDLADASSEQPNWSAIAQEAFENHIRLREAKGVSNMEAAIERIRQSKKKHVATVEAEAKDAGRKAAMDFLEYADLTIISQIAESGVIYNAYDLADKLGYDNYEQLFGDSDEPPADEYVGWWIEGVAEAFAEISEKL